MNFFSRRPFLLYSYLATEMLAPFFASFLVINGVFFLVKLIPFLNFSLDLGIGLADFVRLFSFMLPNMLLYTIPMSSMMGIIICFSRLSNDTEILALKASGISIYRLLPPVFAVAGIIALATGYVSIKLISESDSAMKQLTYQLLKEKLDQGIKEYQFTEALGDLVIHVSEIDRQTGEWKKVWVSDMRGQVNPTITMASTGRMVSDMEQMNVTVLLRNGSLHRPDGKNGQIVKFSKYVIKIPLQLPRSVQTKERKTLTLPALLVSADTVGPDSKQGRSMLVEFHKRLVLPVGCLVLSILGLPLGLLAGPGKKTVGIPIGIGIFILYYIAFSATKTLATDGVAPVALLMWLPNILFAIAAVYSIRKVAHELPIVSETIQEFFKRLYRATLLVPVHWLLNGMSSFNDHVHGLLVRRSRSNPPPDVSQMIKADAARNIFHQPGCKHYCSNGCTMEFESAEEAIKSGFQPCDDCRTSLDEHTEKVR